MDIPVRRRSDQEWLKDTSKDGARSGDNSLEIKFFGDNPDGEWTTHLFKDEDHDRRLSRGDTTAIVIEGQSNERQRAITEAIHSDEVINGKRGTKRLRILAVLAQDEHLDWLDGTRLAAT